MKKHQLVLHQKITHSLAAISSRPGTTIPAPGIPTWNHQNIFVFCILYFVFCILCFVFCILQFSRIWPQHCNILLVRHYTGHFIRTDPGFQPTGTFQCINQQNIRFDQTVQRCLGILNEGKVWEQSNVENDHIQSGTRQPNSKFPNFYPAQQFWLGSRQGGHRWGCCIKTCSSCVLPSPTLPQTKHILSMVWSPSLIR